MRFDPEAGALACPHCGNARPLPPPDPAARALALREIGLREGLALGAGPWGGRLASAQVEETRVRQCPNCGARTETEPGVTAGTCPFCDTPLVGETSPDRHVKPAAMLPFALTEARAKAAMRDWLGSLWFAPNGLKAYARAGRRMSGVYVPHWTFDARTDTRYTGARGITRIETYRTGDGKTATRARTDWYPARGRVRVAFDDVLVLGATSLPEAMTDAIQPWDLRALAPYAPAMVAGFRAEAYTVDLPDAWGRAQVKMRAEIEAAVRRDIGGDQQRITSLDTATSGETFKHVLLPIWVAAYKYAGRSFRFVVNARSGAVSGERPYSKWKIALAVLAALIAAAVAAYVYDASDGRFGDAGGAPVITVAAGGPCPPDPPPGHACPGPASDLAASSSA